jgi:hypothetical protein
MKAKLRLEGQQINLKSDIRVLGVQLDSTLRWKPHLRVIEAKSVHLVNALRTITGSTWGSSIKIGVAVYKIIVRPALTYGVSLW